MNHSNNDHPIDRTPAGGYQLLNTYRYLVARAT